MIEDPPLLVVCRAIIVDSESHLSSSNVLGPEKGEVVWSLSLKLEFGSTLERLFWILDSLGVEVPGLVQAVVAVVPECVHVVMVSTTIDIQALSTVVPDVSSASSPEGDMLVVASVVKSHDSGGIVFHGTSFLA